MKTRALAGDALSKLAPPDVLVTVHGARVADELRAAYMWISTNRAGVAPQSVLIGARVVAEAGQKLGRGAHRARARTPK